MTIVILDQMLRLWRYTPDVIPAKAGIHASLIT